MNQDAATFGSAVNSAGQGLPNLRERHLSDRSMEKCAECRRRKKGCRPINRIWPDHGKCEECAKAGLECGPNTRYRIGVEDVSSQPNEQENPESTPARPVPNSRWNQIKDIFERFYIDDRMPLKEVMRIMQAQYDFSASKRQYHGQITKWGLTKYKKGTGSRMATTSNTSSPLAQDADLAPGSISSSVEPSNIMQMPPPERPATFSDAARHFLDTGLGIGRSPLQHAMSHGQPAHDNFILVQPGAVNMFDYSPLPNARDIRLIRLLPGHRSEPISIELHVTDLDRADEYEAVSWAWESEKDTENVLLHNVPCQIKKGLEVALHYLRDENMPRTLWIDAICINHEDKSEKSKQVQLMADIYSDATAVLVWLGPDTARSSGAIKFVQAVLDISALEDLIQSPKSLHLWEAFCDMLKLPWFRRVWALHEVSIARTCTLHWGNSKVSWSDFADAVDMVRSLEGSLQTSYITSATLGRTGDVFHQLRVSNVMQLVSTSRLTTISSRSGPLAERKPSLETLLHEYRSSQLTDPRDRVYALLGLTRDWKADDSQRHLAGAVSAGTPIFDTPSSTDTGPERVDFTLFSIDYRKPVWKICIEVIELVLRQSDSIDIICRPWAPEWPGLPSWISTLGRDSFKMAKSGLYTRVNADALVGAPGHVGKPYNACRKTQAGQGRFGQVFESGIFVVKGFALCSISYVASVAIEGCVPADWLALGQWNYPEELPPDAFLRTLVADRDDSGKKPPPTWFARVCRWVFNQIVPGEPLNTNEMIRMPRCPPYVAVFLRRMQSVVWKRRLFVTKEGYIGIGPEQMQAGDSVNILLGCSVPVVLRAIMDDMNHYSLIGDCYVHGMMDGEARRDDPAFSEYYLR